MPHAGGLIAHSNGGLRWSQGLAAPMLVLKVQQGADTQKDAVSDQG